MTRSEEPLVTLKVAAEKLGLPAFKVARAAKAGIFPTYSLFNKRKLVRISEIVAAIETSRSTNPINSGARQ